MGDETVFIPTWFFLVNIPETLASQKPLSHD
jgi:hypothetical protein